MTYTVWHDNGMKGFLAVVFAGVALATVAEPFRDGDTVVFHSARWFYGNRGAPVDDVAAFSAWFERNEKDKTGYFAKFVPGYLEYWPRHEEVRRALRDERRTVRALARPQPHRYEITAWDDDGGH